MLELATLSAPRFQDLLRRMNFPPQGRLSFLNPHARKSGNSGGQKWVFWVPLEPRHDRLSVILGGEPNDRRRPSTVRVEDLAYSNMLTVNALVELLDEKGVLHKTEVLERIKKLGEEARKGGR